MADGGRKVLGVDICVADTGIAGPDGAVPGKPVGLFYLGLANKDAPSVGNTSLKAPRREQTTSRANSANVGEGLSQRHINYVDIF